MFKLINKEDSKVFSSSMFIKNADFFKDEIAFFDAFSKLCEKELRDLPNYCAFQSGKLCLEGVCLFFKTYASEFGFKTIDLSLDYLKTLYYAIAALSSDGVVVEKDVVLNEYLVYKEANEKQFAAINGKLSKVEQVHHDNLNKFERSNNKYARSFVAAKVLNIVAIVVVVLSFLAAVIPVAFYYAQRIELKSMLLETIGILLIGLIIKFELNIISKYLSEFAMDCAYTLQTLKKNKDATFVVLNEMKLQNSKILSEHYEYSKGLNADIVKNNLEFDQVLKLATKKHIMSFNIRADVLKMDNEQQKEVYQILDRLANVSANDVGRLENIYGDICEKDYLKYNNLIRFSFLNRFIENATITKNWRLDLAGVQTNPFDIDAKRIADEQIVYVQNENEPVVTRLSVFFDTKLAKKKKELQLKNIKNETSYNVAKMEYINRFCNYEKIKKIDSDFFASEEENSKQLSSEIKNDTRQIPAYVSLRLALIKNRIICNTLGAVEFEKIKNILSSYELSKGDENQEVKTKTFINEDTVENKNFIRSIFECDEIRDIGNDKVLCIYGNQQFIGFKLSNI